MVSPHAPPVDTLDAALRWRAAQTPDRIAMTWLADGERDERHLTYAQLDRGARRVAAWLEARQARGERVLLMYEEGLDYLIALFGAMYAGALACPVHPPDPRRLARTLPRLTSIAKDAGVRFVFTTRDLLGPARDALVDDPVLGRAEWVATEALEADPDTWADPHLGPHDLAYLQYTSGSTSTPKGVMISHLNLTHQLTDFDVGYEHGPDSVMVTWLPATHDLGLVYGRLMPLWMGFRCVFLSPAAFMARPMRWLEAMSRYRGTHAPSPNFGYEVAARKATPDEVARLDLSSVRVLLNGAEPIREASEQAFVRTFAPARLSPTAMTHAMGMSESTAKIVTEPIDRTPPRFVSIDGDAYERNEVVLVAETTPGARRVASCGRTVLDTEVAIVEPASCTRLGPDQVGEMWVRGTTVAQGYWNLPEATEATFHAHTRDGQGPWLRTGDLAFVHEGEVYLSGRLKDVLIVRGQNHHPQDIEWTVCAAHPALRPNCAAVFGWRDAHGDEKVGVLTEVVADRMANPEDVFAAVRAAVAEHGLSASGIGLLAERQLPKTSSGKIQRSAAKAAFLDDTLPWLARYDAPEVVETSPAPTDDLLARLATLRGRRREEALVDAIVADVAKLMGFAPADIDADRPFGETGLDSVRAVDLVERLGGRLSLQVPGTALFDHPTPVALSQALLARLDRTPATAPAAPTSPQEPVGAMSDEAALAELLALLKK